MPDKGGEFRQNHYTDAQVRQLLWEEFAVWARGETVSVAPNGARLWNADDVHRFIERGKSAEVSD